MAEVIVIGGGIIGSAIAYHTAAAGRETLLFDREDEGEATAAGAGIVSPETSRHASDTWYELAVRSAAYYPKIAAELTDAGITDTGFARPGTLVVDPAAYDPSPFDEGSNRIFDRQARWNHPAPETLDRLPGSSAPELFPPLAPTRHAIMYEDGGRVHGPTFRDALQSASDPDCFEFVRAPVSAIEVDNGAVVGVTANGTTYAARTVVVAGGAWSPAFADDLGIDIPVSPQRGQIIRIATDRDTQDWPIVNTFQGYYLVPWADGSISVGATREDGTGFDPRVTAGGVFEVLEAVHAIADGLTDATVDSIAVGLRPTSDDGLPIIGPVPGVDGAYLATGHGSTGLQLGPYTGKLIEMMIADTEPDFDWTPYAPGRFLED